MESRSLSSLKYDYLIKVKTVGDSNVGKSSIVLRFVDDTFTGQMAPTIGVEYKSKIFDVYGKKVKATIWDTAGAERYRTITKAYYKGADGILVVFDLTDKESFVNVDGWLKEIQNHCGTDVSVIVLANKSDVG